MEVMAKFRKKPVVVDAVQVFKQEDFPEVITLSFKDEDTGVILGPTVMGPSPKCKVVMSIKTLEGWHEVSQGDWVIKGVNGEFYPCKPDIFEKTYEAVD